MDILRRVLACLAVLLSTGAADAQTPASGDAAALYRTVAPAVFLVEVRNDAGQDLAFGSAFLVAHGRLITNAHVVDGGKPFLKTGAVVLPLTIDRLDANADLAVLSAPTRLEATPLPLADSFPAVGSRIYAIGNPRGLERTISQGIVSGHRTFNGRDLIQITAPISPGSSGGPVVDGTGRVVGVTVAYLDNGQNLNFAVPVSRVAAILESASAPAFAAMIARARSIAEHAPSSDSDQKVWNNYHAQLGDALSSAAAAAREGGDFLELATLAADKYEFDMVPTLAEQALSHGTDAPDSARILMIESWELHLLLDDSVPTDTLQRYLIVADTLVRHRPDRSGTYLFLGRVLARLPARQSQALPTARKAIGITKKQGKVSNYIWSTLHYLAAATGTPAQDDSAFHDLVASGTADYLDWASHAGHLEARGEWTDAANTYVQAYKAANGKWPTYACKAASAFWKADLNDQALDGFRACIQGYAVAATVDTSEVEYAHRGIATILVQRGVYPTAETHARQALQLNPTDAWAANALAGSLMGQERYSEAAAAAEEAIRLSDGGIAVMHFTAGSAYFQMRDWSRCEQAFEKADELSPDPATAYNTALCLAHEGYYQDAAEWMEKVLARDPNRPDQDRIRRMIRSWLGS
jgi:S1-C subfamily serine protease